MASLTIDVASFLPSSLLSSFSLLNPGPRQPGFPCASCGNRPLCHLSLRDIASFFPCLVFVLCCNVISMGLYTSVFFVRACEYFYVMSVCFLFFLCVCVWDFFCLYIHVFFSCMFVCVCVFVFWYICLCFVCLFVCVFYVSFLSVTACTFLLP